VLKRCWLGDRKGIQPVKTHSEYPRVTHKEDELLYTQSLCMFNGIVYYLLHVTGILYFCTFLVSLG